MDLPSQLCHQNQELVQDLPPKPAAIFRSSAKPGHKKSCHNWACRLLTFFSQTERAGRVMGCSPECPAIPLNYLCSHFLTAQGFGVLRELGEGLEDIGEVPLT